MTNSKLTSTLIDYPESDGQPMTESDATRDYLLYCVEALEFYFQQQREVYVSGNLFVYYEEGNPQASISPDVFVIFGVSKSKRRSYKAWQEGNKLPDFILEVTSFSTRKVDEEEKPLLYARLGVQEYFQYDPTADYLNPQLKGATLVNGIYQPLPLEYLEDGTPLIHSQVLDLDLRLQQPYGQEVQSVPGSVQLPLELRLYDLKTGTKLLTYHEMEQARSQAVQRLIAMGLTVEQVAEALSLSIEQVRERL